MGETKKGSTKIGSLIVLRWIRRIAQLVKPRLFLHPVSIQAVLIPHRVAAKISAGAHRWADRK